MNLLGLFLRALFGRPRRRRVIYHKSSELPQRGLADTPWRSQNRPNLIVVQRTEICGQAWVIDGDTIDISGTRIRLAGIDAPELDHPYGKNAKWALLQLCKGQEIRAVFGNDLSHDRAVATCYLPDGRDLSAEMVKAGMAIDWPKFSGGKYSAYEISGIRKKLWRCDARQKGRMPPSLPY